MKRTSIASVLLLAAALALGAQGQVAKAAKAPSVDAAVDKGEYALSFSKSGMDFSFALSPDGTKLYAAIEAPTAGWVSLGLGSLRMNGAWMVMGQDKGGKAVVTEQVGKGHGHSDALSAKVLESAVKTTGKRTVMEFAVLAADFVKDGKVDLIYASGGDGFASFHTGGKGSFTLSVAK
jgi:hypothetical protein